MIVRENCIICKNGKLSNFIEYDMPSYNGAVDNCENYTFNEMKFSSCNNCNSIQLSEILEQEVVYGGSHNRETVGEIWQNHYEQFRNFIGDISEKTVLEISDPSAKLAKKNNNFNKWYIIEPNSDESKSTEKIIFIKDFFDSKFKVSFSPDLIVLSHFFEHTFEPHVFLEKCFDTLEYDGDVFISIPNLLCNLETLNQPNSIVHFEHTFFYDNETVEFLFENNGFEVVKKQNYLSHSIFYQIRKKSDISKNNSPVFTDRKEDFINIYNRYLRLIEVINNTDDEFILFGCHVYSQFLIQNGLNLSKIKFILDNDSSKQNKYLYGTSLMTYNPKELDLNDCKIITSHMGTYVKEIEESLKDSYKKITFF